MASAVATISAVRVASVGFPGHDRPPDYYRESSFSMSLTPGGGLGVRPHALVNEVKDPFLHSPPWLVQAWIDLRVEDGTAWTLQGPGLFLESPGAQAQTWEQDAGEHHFVFREEWIAEANGHADGTVCSQSSIDFPDITLKGNTAASSDTSIVDEASNVVDENTSEGEHTIRFHCKAAGTTSITVTVRHGSEEVQHLVMVDCAPSSSS